MKDPTPKKLRVLLPDGTVLEVHSNTEGEPTDEELAEMQRAYNQIPELAGCRVVRTGEGSDS